MDRVDLTDNSQRWFDREQAKQFVSSASLHFWQTRLGGWIRNQSPGVPLLETFTITSWQMVYDSLEANGKAAEIARVRWDGDAALEV